MSDYDVILEKEIMLEAYAGLLADFERMMKKFDINENDESNLIAKIYWQLNDIHKHILGARYETMNDMLEVRGQLKFFKDYLKGLQ